MELMITIPEEEWDDKSSIHAKKSYTNKVMNELKEISNDIDFEIKGDNIGIGADWPTLLITIGSIIIIGKEINECIDGWSGLAKKFNGVLFKLKKDFGKTFISEDCAKLLCLDYLFKNEKVNSIRVIDSKKVKLENISGIVDNSELSSNPFSLYVLFFKVNDEKVYIFGVKSTGDIEFNYCLNVEEHYVF